MDSSLDLSNAEKARELLREKLFSPSSSRQGTTFSKDEQKRWPESRRRAFSTVHDLLERTILHGEGNSLLVIGSRGSGKSWVLDKVMKSLESDKRCRQNFIKVELNGFVHTDDRAALLAIARQLDVENDPGEKIALSFSGALEYLLEALRSGNRANQSIVFLLDEFDLFAHHKNQTLLYNLFDATQSADNPIAVIGLSCRLDAVELLEKRVKSRFSHRQVTLFSDFTFQEYVDLFTSLLSLPADFGDKVYLGKWNEQLKELSQNKTVLEVLKRRYNTAPNIRSLVSLLTMPVCRLSVRRAFLTTSDLVYSYRLLTMESVAAMLRGVSVLELCLIIAMKHIVELNGDDPFNFEMVYSEYKKFTQRSSSVEFFKKAVALKAFEHLIALEFVCPAESGGVAHSVTHHQSGKVMKEFQPMILMLEGEQIRRAVQSYHNCPTDIARWGTSTAMK